MTIFCPTCHHVVSEVAPAVALRDAPMRRQCRIVLGLLVDAYPKAVSRGRIIDAVYGADPNGGPEDAFNSVRVLIVEIRKHIRPYGWTIPRSSGAYKLVPSGDEV